MSQDSYKIGVIGGTGPQGRGLAYRMVKAGRDVVIGSRSPERAEEVATSIRDRISGSAQVVGAGNLDAAARADVVVLAVPYDGQAALVTDLAPVLAGKVIISCVNPLGFDGRGPFALTVPDGSAAEEVQRIVADARVVGAFHHLSAAKLWSEAELLDEEDVLVCGEDAEAKALVLDLAGSVTGRRGIDAGRLLWARQLEPLTGVLISINKQYKVRSGLSLTGLTHR